LYVATFVAMSGVEVLFRQQFRRDLRAGPVHLGLPNPPLALQRITDAGNRSLILILSDINMHNAPNPHVGACQHRTCKIVEQLELELMDRPDRQRIFAQHPGSLSGRNLARRLFQVNQEIRESDLQEDWLAHGKEVFPVLREKFPRAYFSGLVALARIVRWEGDGEAVFDRTLSPDQIMDRLEERVGPEGRKLFEKFIKQVNVLQAKQQLEAQAQMGITGRLRRAARPV
jgi:hypothetical protein